ncbi:hypothetical protein U9M48_017338 [Paspalum notatum var. saurae]|uniref:Uncharacterized protein n=1 Tax=Paspalum notatum var. saurae TaxID=547442 RepID=A0AAQ3T7H7_PASNO
MSPVPRFRAANPTTHSPPHRLGAPPVSTAAVAVPRAPRAREEKEGTSAEEVEPLALFKTAGRPQGWKGSDCSIACALSLVSSPSPSLAPAGRARAVRRPAPIEVLGSEQGARLGSSSSLQGRAVSSSWLFPLALAVCRCSSRLIIVRRSFVGFLPG